MTRSQSFMLPENANMESIEAVYENGILNVAIAKSEAAKPRRIEIANERKGFLGKLLGDGASKKEKTVNVA